MNRSNLSFAACLLAATLFFGCKKSSSPDVDKGPGHIPEYISTSINGRVLSDDGTPVSGATIKAGNSTATSDINGLFSFSNISLDKKASVIKVEKADYFTGIKTLITTAGSYNQVSIQLIKKKINGTINAGSGGTVTLTEGGSVKLESNSVITESNKAPYTGTVSVSAFFINPSAPNFTDIMPGTLRGITTTNNETGLESFGMMAVELSGAGGEKLQVTPGKQATIRFPIPTALQAKAPATIPLWHLNDTTGLWQEEGVATKQGTEYVGTVGHFSFWNCDAPIPLVDFTASFRTQNGTAVAGAKVMISLNGQTNISGSGFTGSDGSVHGLVPANQKLTMKVYNTCGGEIFSREIGTLSTATDLGSFTVTLQTEVVTISGTVNSCTNSQIANGYVTIQVDSVYYRASVTNGTYAATITRCTPTPVVAKLTAYDLATGQSSGAVTVNVAGTTVNAGPVMACGVLPDQYIFYTLNNNSDGFVAPVDSINAYAQTYEGVFYTSIEGRNRTSGSRKYFGFSFKGSETTGIHPCSFIIASSDNHTWYPSEETNTTITRYDVATGYVEGNFSTIARDTVIKGSRASLNAFFRVKRS